MWLIVSLVWIIYAMAFVAIYCIGAESASERWCSRFTYALIFANCWLSFDITRDIFFLYSSPHVPVSSVTAFDISRRLLTCADIFIPSLRKEWAGIRDCLKTTNVYNITPANIPSSIKSNTEAFVFTMLDKKSIFVTSLYLELNDIQRSLVLIHECAHIALGAVDHAYVWEQKFRGLTEKEHYENADSFKEMIAYHCT